MNQQTRIIKIEEILQSEPLGTQEIMWQDSLQSMPVHKVPLNCLIYNKYNGRILSRTKSLEAQGRVLDAESEDDKVVIEKLLWDSKIDRNKRTMDDLARDGQKHVGIITKDGIIIDGNRRVMLLNKIERFDYFKAIVLPITSEENPVEIEKLETSYQMGEDAKLGYNPVEKYLKAKNLKQKDIDVNRIADWMGESPSSIKDYLEIMETMEEYLDYFGYHGIFTQLDGREDQFINLNKWIRAFYGAGSTKAFDGYKDGDVDDLKTIAFDYIRVRFEGKRFRSLGEGLREKHFFGNREIWESFRDTHFENIPPIHKEEESIDFDSSNIQATLNERDDKFRERALDLLDDNLSEHLQKIYNQRHKNEPEKLMAKSIDAVNVAKTNRNIEKPGVLDKVEQLNAMTTDILRKKSPRRLLERILQLLSSVVVEEDADEQEQLLQHAKDIGKKAYQLEKQIKNLK